MTSEQLMNNRNVIIRQPGLNNLPRYEENSTQPQPPTGGYQQPTTTCPPGLEYLIHLDAILLDQEVESFEVISGIHTPNRYTIVDSRRQPLYIVREQSGWFMRACIGRLRSFEMSIYDRVGRIALTVKRPLKFIGDEMHVYNGENLLGSIKKIVMSCSPDYRICDENNMEILKIRGPICICGYNFQFSILTGDTRMIGILKKHWSGIAREIFTNADVFSVTFPVDLNVKLKALLLATALLIDYGYFE